MITADTVRLLALALPETGEEPHHAITSFRVKKKIFATLNPPENRATLRFSAEMQDIFTRISQGAIFPVPNAWGKFGWTTVDLGRVAPELFEDALRIAWREAAPAVFRKKYTEWFEDEE